MDLNETLRMITYMLIPAFFSLLGMAALGSPAIALLGEISAKSQKKVFFDKYGQQSSAMGLMLTLFTLVIYGITLGIFLFKSPQGNSFVLDTKSPLFIPLLSYAVFIVVGILYFATWKKLRNLKSVHMLLGVISTLSAMVCVAYAIYAKLSIALTMGSDAAGNTATAISMAQPMSTMFVFLVLSVAAALSVTYLVLRREKDDFGRDYYNFALKLASRWAVLPMIAFLGCQGWLFVLLPQNFKTLVLDTPLAYVWASLVGLGVICVILWMALARSESPLRLKGVAFVAAALLWIMHTLNATLFMNFMSML
ncbi:hypothetical protein [Pseudodesulfovibrio sediminis]|uniref:Uncharacterized protein n=1 Tax=Pseudodesulfovibrio sediminis TaxID=2810563 RepID=A0ABM7P296_9BACT|nr:hypothetical protein [Pseudodesulfovibrio sediminis]BCS86921.1 hypothetical protein PSDVSF_01630 [Pseudodesulfovibrio sediminis]